MVIYLIGMPASGKSKTARHLNEVYGLKIVDLDKYIEEKAKMDIPTIFSRYGEDYFRNLEKEALKSFDDYQEDLIVSCGGGIIKDINNKEIMKNGLVVFLDAAIELIKSHLESSSTVRPLLKEKSIEVLYQERIDLYLLFADYIIKYEDYEGAALKVMEILHNTHKKKILIINGPNLNMLGLRDPNHYGSLTLEEINDMIRKDSTFEYEFFQSNHEGMIIDKIQQYKNYDAIVINPAAYTHTSLAIHDALEIVDIPKVEVHLSDIDSREEYRKVNFIRSVVDQSFQGGKALSYLKAIEYLKKKLNVL